MSCVLVVSEDARASRLPKRNKAVCLRSPEQSEKAMGRVYQTRAGARLLGERQWYPTHLPHNHILGATADLGLEDTWQSSPQWMGLQRGSDMSNLLHHSCQQKSIGEESTAQYNKESGTSGVHQVQGCDWCGPHSVTCQWGVTHWRILTLANLPVASSQQPEPTPAHHTPSRRGKDCPT